MRRGNVKSSTGLSAPRTCLIALYDAYLEMPIKSKGHSRSQMKQREKKNFYSMDYNDIDFAKYGRQVEIKEPWRGYHRGTIIAQTTHGFIVEFSSGAHIEVSRDEVEFD